MSFFKKKNPKKVSNEKKASDAGYPKQMSYPVQQQGVPYQDMPPPYSEATGQCQPQGPQTQMVVPQAIFIQAGFDAGARFDDITPPRIPPPPPGTFMHPAQIAASMGQPVQMTQRKAGYFEGGSNGGFTLF